MPLVRVIDSCVVYDEDSLSHVPLRKGDSFDSKHELVRKRPDLFRAEIEQATAGPGERRK
jgi:hypothetical protein